MTIVFADHSLGAIFGVSLAAILIASEIGHRLGLRAPGEANVTTLEAAILGLLALMISFTFAMALTRFDARRQAALNEASAIRTAAMRARLLPLPHAAESVKLLREYAEISLDVKRRVAAADDPKIDRISAIEEALWRQVKLVIEKNNSMVPVGLYIEALNEIVDDHEKSLTAMRTRVPEIVLWSLYGVAIIAVGFAGFASGMEGKSLRLPVYITGILSAGVILLIQDIDRPREGFIAVSQQPMIDTVRALASYEAEAKDDAPQRPITAEEKITATSTRAGAGDFDARGQIPCAQAKGQPMGRCDFGVTRAGGGSATVMVTLPDGRKRAIFFNQGKAISADTSQAGGYPKFSAKKESDLYIIHAGEERFEIPEAVITGG